MLLGGQEPAVTVVGRMAPFFQIGLALLVPKARTNTGHHGLAPQGTAAYEVVARNGSTQHRGPPVSSRLL